MIEPNAEEGTRPGAGEARGNSAETGAPLGRVWLSICCGATPSEPTSMRLSWFSAEIPRAFSDCGSLAAAFACRRCCNFERGFAGAGLGDSALELVDASDERTAAGAGDGKGDALPEREAASAASLLGRGDAETSGEVCTLNPCAELELS